MEEYTKIEKKSMSPLTAFILVIGGIIIAVIVVAGVLANRGLEKLENGGIEVTVHDDQLRVVIKDETLPASVEDTRQLIAEAAKAKDYEKLNSLAGESFSYTFGVDEPGGFGKKLKELSAAGKDPFGLIIKLFAMPHEKLGDIYVWPAFFTKEPKDWTENDLKLMATLATEKEIESYRQYGGYVGYRLGIREDGTWLYFIAGD